MIRVDGAHDWNAEQLEAAAAALGAFVASNMRMGGFINHPGLDDPRDLQQARAMDAAANQVVFWAAKEAGSYARAAERERERQAEWLARNEFVKVCAWCNPGVTEADCPACCGTGQHATDRPVDDPRNVCGACRGTGRATVTHGICSRCAARQLAEITDPRA